jgi:4-amino-4-deoxy-L-arabinose transferase-like glycosyltransferase
MWRPRLGAWLALLGVLVVAGVLFGRGLDAATNYDEGVYLASLDALTHDQALGKDVYASQPPGFYVLLQALSFLPGDGVEGIRVAFLLVAVAGLAAAYAIGRRLADVGGGLFAAALLAVTAPYAVQAPRIQADTASVVLALCAFSALLYARRRSALAVGAGALAGAAVSVKLLALPIVVPIVVLLVAWRSWRLAGAVVTGAAAVWVGLLLAPAGAVPELWRSVVTDHRAARGLGPSLVDNLRRVVEHPLDWRTPAAVLVVAGLVCAAVWLRRVETLALAAWIATSAVFLAFQRPLLDHHFVLLAAVLAVTAGCGLGVAARHVPVPAKYAAVGVIALALAAGLAQEERRLGRQAGEPAAVRQAAHELAARTHQDELVGTDLPIVAYLADRRVPGQLVDTSFVRLGGGSLPNSEILDTLERDHVDAVVAARLFRERPALLAALRKRYRERVLGSGVTIYLGRRS